MKRLSPFLILVILTGAVALCAAFDVRCATLTPRVRSLSILRATAPSRCYTNDVVIANVTGSGLRYSTDCTTWNAFGSSVSLSVANTWTQLQTFTLGVKIGGANFTSGSGLPSGAACTVDADIGALYIRSTPLAGAQLLFICGITDGALGTKGWLAVTGAANADDV